MELHSEQYSITITKQDSASQHNILKEQYDYIYDPDNYLSADEYCFFDILIKSTAQTRRLALVSFPYLETGTIHVFSAPATALQKEQFGEIIVAEKEKRLIKHTFKTTEAEAETIRRKMKSLGIRNESAYMRAMALNGYILKLDLPQIREMLRLLRNMTNNLNQISKRLNAHGQMYETEIEEVQQKQNELWVMMRQLLSLLDRSE